MRRVACSVFVLALLGSAAIGISSAQAEGEFSTFVSCNSTSRAVPSHRCFQGETPGAFFESSTDVEYEVCVSFPTGRQACRPHQDARAERLYVNTITSEILGTHEVVWKVEGVEVGAWSFRLTRTPRLTSSTASRHFKANIFGQFPTAVFPAAEGKPCPEVFGEGSDQFSLCFAEYRTGKTWHFQGASAKLEAGEVAFSYPRHSTWQRKWRRCRLPRRVPGKLLSNDNCGYGRPESDVYLVDDELVADIRLHRALQPIGWQFVDSIGFDSLGRYTGKKRGGSYIFTNAVGDSFRYKP